MISCKIIKKDADRTYFETEIEGTGFDTLSELIRINAEFVEAMRKCKLPEELIKKQLIDCVIGGFEMVNYLEQN